VRTKTRLAAALAVALVLAGCHTPPAPTSTEDVDNVAVLVIDNFNAEPSLPDTGDANCPHTTFGRTASGANEVDGTGAGDGLPASVSHGETVFQDLKTELTGLMRGQGMRVTPEDLRIHGLDGPSVHTETGILNDYMAKWRYKDKDVLLLGVDTNDYTTADVNTHLKALVSAISGNVPSPIRRVVLNMSFVIAPCNVQKWLRANGANPDSERWFAAYRAAVDTDPDLADLKATIEAYANDADPMGRVTRDSIHFAVAAQRVAINRFYSLLLDDPRAANPRADIGRVVTDSAAGTQSPAVRAYRQVTEDPLNGGDGIVHWLPPSPFRSIAVGAAGNGITIPTPDGQHGRNFRFAFPFAPAMWSDVISIGASTPNGQTLTDYSNHAEVILPGNFDFSGWKVYPLNGTSYAAPRMSAKDAIYLLTGGETPCDGMTPPLGYAEERVLKSSDWADNWKDLTFSKAEDLCAQFKTRTTLQGPTPS
jgi:hypothetical protein